MTILALDTCMAACSAAVLGLSQDEPLSTCFEPMERGHAEALFPMISAVMSEAGVAFTDLTKIAVTRGPGTFTGVRAGVAAGRGLALGCGVPVVAATSLEVMALGCVALLSAAQRAKGFLIAHDARRGEFYVQQFDPEGHALSRPALVTLSDAALLAAVSGLVAGSGAQSLAREALSSGHRVHACLPDLLPNAAHLARLANHLEPDGGPVSPLYLRAPDAKPQTDKSLARV